MPGLDRVESFALIDQPSIRPRQRPADRGGGRRPLRRRHFGSVSSERTASPWRVVPDRPWLAAFARASLLRI